VVNTKFLGLQIDNHLNCKSHIEHMIPKLSAACYAVRSVVHISNSNTLKSIYWAYFHSITKYEIIFWGNSSNNKQIFTSQKKVLRIMVGVQSTSCISLFKQLQISPTSCQYIFLLMNFTVIIKKFCKQIHLYIILIQGISTIFIHQMPTYLVFKQVYFMLASKFSTG
jgi:hypothetical protein